MLLYLWHKLELNINSTFLFFIMIIDYYTLKPRYKLPYIFIKILIEIKKSQKSRSKHSNGSSVLLAQYHKTIVQFQNVERTMIAVYPRRETILNDVNFGAESCHFSYTAKWPTQFVFRRHARLSLLCNSVVLLIIVLTCIFIDIKYIPIKNVYKLYLFLNTNGK